MRPFSAAIRGCFCLSVDWRLSRGIPLRPEDHTGARCESQGRPYLRGASRHRSFCALFHVLLLATFRGFGLLMCSFRHYGHRLRLSLGRERRVAPRVAIISRNLLGVGEGPRNELFRTNLPHFGFELPWPIRLLFIACLTNDDSDLAEGKHLILLWFVAPTRIN